jgi:hypothetical protein
MKNTNKLALFIFICLTVSNLPIYSFFYNDGGYPNNTLSGAAIGGLAGGRKGAAIGLGVGAGMDMMGAAARNDRRRRDDDDYYSRKRSRRSQRNLEDENAELRARLEQYENYQE